MRHIAVSVSGDWSASRSKGTSEEMMQPTGISQDPSNPGDGGRVADVKRTAMALENYRDAELWYKNAIMGPR